MNTCPARSRSFFFTLKPLMLAPLLLSGNEVFAETISTDRSINGATPITDYRVINGATLTANGASTLKVNVEQGSDLKLNGSSVAGTGSGVALLNSTASIVGSSITGTTVGLSLGKVSTVPGGSSATVQDSTISAGLIGVQVGTFADFTARNSQISGNTVGLQMGNGSATLYGGTLSGGNGVGINPGSDLSVANKLVLDGVTVQGTTGAALLVGDYGLPSTAAEIYVNNGTTLQGSNGVLLDVIGNAAANMTVDNSQLTGDVVAQQGATAHLVLQNSATLTGNLSNVERVDVDSSAQWILTGDGRVDNLALGGGTVRFGGPGEFHVLSVDNLSGNGTFAMEADFAEGKNDFLDVADNASGNHQLAVTASGEDPLSDTRLHMVHIGAGDAQFSLLGGPVDQGTWSYDLMREGNDWYLDASTKTISPSTSSVLALFNAAPTVWYGELTTLRTRMGELRSNPGNAGGWMRAYGSRYDVEQSAGVGYRQSMSGLSLGADAPLPFGDGQWLIGVMAGYSKSDLDLQRGTTATINSYYAGGYATWLDQQSGYYVDGVVKFNHLRNKADVAMSDGQQSNSDYDTNGLGASLEFGRHIRLANGYFIEPFAQVSGLALGGEDYQLSNGMRAEGERTGSLLAKMGATAGRNFDVGDGRVLQPYVRAALAHEFMDENEVQVNDNRFNNDLSGSRGELGAGVAMSVSKQWQMHADFDYSRGNRIEQPWGANIGLRYSW
ncbi:autotransporter outer membrane beta-barrel domain-containing protein [Pseudomonas viridiflava]|uniref:Outer membrane autotransporter barrel n=1 Tax=Pseudomonas viridiflava TaxID=33069 RepID=A0A3M5P3C5_PSEVI|nr:autotransporter outer membrane beta-barrel domain-containing protein [Pseudomonas viridiflava]RMT79200.1 Outer membrane autotransporter barrel [Pseudomonas viridiflava]